MNVIINKITTNQKFIENHRNSSKFREISHIETLILNISLLFYLEITEFIKILNKYIY